MLDELSLNRMSLDKMSLNNFCQTKTDELSLSGKAQYRRPPHCSVCFAINIDIIFNKKGASTRRPTVLRSSGRLPWSLYSLLVDETSLDLVSSDEMFYIKISFFFVLCLEDPF